MMRNCFNIIATISLFFVVIHSDIKFLVPLSVIGILVLLMVNSGAVILGFSKVRSLLTGFKTIHASLFFLFIAVPIWRVRSTQSFYSDPLDPAAQYKIACMGIAGILAIVSLVSHIGKNRTSFPLIPLLISAYAVVGLLSTLLGGNVYYGIYKSVELLVDTTFLFAAVMQLNTLKDAKKLGDFVLFFCFLLLVVEVITAIVNPEAGFYVYEKGVIGRIFSGAFPLMDPNGLGFLSATLAIASACRILNADHGKSKQLYMLTLMFSLTTLTLAQSRSSIFGMLVGSAFVLVLGRRWKVLAAISVVALVGFAMFSDTFVSYIMRGQSVEMFEKVSGRTLMWGHVWNRFLEKPVLGYGFVSAGFLMKIYAPGQTAPVFNSYLECLHNTGIVGFSPWIIAILITLFLLLRGSMQSRYPHRNALLQGFNSEKLGIMIVLLFRSTTTSMLTIHSIEFTLFLTLIVAAQANLLPANRVSRSSLF